MEDPVTEAIQLARQLAQEAQREATWAERRRQRQLARIVGDDQLKQLVMELLDQIVRGDKLQLTENTRCLTWLERAALRLLPIGMLRAIVRRQARGLVVPAEPDALHQHIRMRRAQGARLNINLLGEAILGEEEAKRRLEALIELLADPLIDTLSVKISSICSQIDLVDREATLDRLAERLRELYRAAMRHGHKLIYLDMEEYRDLRLTMDLFCRVLDEPEFAQMRAGIVLQAYIPESSAIQSQLIDWSRRRIERGCAPSRMRLVKGANLAMERVEASLKDWHQAPFLSKEETDAHYLIMLEHGCQYAEQLHLGVASHNLFDLAYALIVRRDMGLESFVEIEMLEGMAEPLRRVLQPLAGQILLYCPAVRSDRFLNGIAYLIRRLDEQTAPGHFLRDALDLQVDSSGWKRQESAFRKACKLRENLDLSSRRTKPMPTENCPDTDWAQPGKSDWIRAALEEWRPLDVELLEMDQLAETIQRAIEAQSEWSQKSVRGRAELLQATAQLMQQRRGQLIAVMNHTTGKVVAEGDPEVSEAIDFLTYYGPQMEQLAQLKDIQWEARGVALVTPPWNFPCSIPTGQVASALITGNSVLLKPAPQAIQVAAAVAQCFWDAGCPRALLQLIPCDEQTVGTELVSSPEIDLLLLTGATDTARLFMELRPGGALIAETGGKNSMIITRAADRELAVQQLVRSAFGHAGQKCSAASLAIADSAVYNDPHFLSMLRDAANSLLPGVHYGPLISDPSPKLQWALTQLDPGEEWLLKPRQLQPRLWTPGIKLHVQPNSRSHLTEFFGPVLSLMRASDLDQAITFANATPYGLTAGLQSLDLDEQHQWLRSIEAGNLYINRTITGAIVGRQPFGGCKESAFGIGFKAGGPNALIPCTQPQQRGLPADLVPIDPRLDPLIEQVQPQLPRDKLLLWRASLGSYCYWWNQWRHPQPLSNLIGEDNWLECRPHLNQLIWISPSAQPIDWGRTLAIVQLVGHTIPISHEDESTLCARLEKESIRHLRLFHPPSRRLQETAAHLGCTLLHDPVMANGRIELLRTLREVSVSRTSHRHGHPIRPL